MRASRFRSQFINACEMAAATAAGNGSVGERVYAASEVARHCTKQVRRGSQPLSTDTACSV